jgi:hypothetical protein
MCRGILQSVGYHNNGDRITTAELGDPVGRSPVSRSMTSTPTTPPMQDANRTIRPVLGGLIKRRISRLKELIRRYRRVLETDRGR